ncbi:MAG TPA: heparan-alpha-glucosaminide N-acetyltransferase domain-containing protein [Bryobacteraceae bacterium]|nr:heparan-alpha-glucosaminide N-acetyltransferase domain-containing protein [Bryobacteraceae bacterium]
MNAPKSRVQSVDALRGLVMIIMALDHLRESFHAGAMTFSPEDLSRTTAAIFFTRWITHLCAPVFMFTTGIGAFFWMSRGHTARELGAFLWKRGLWLIVLEFTVFRLAMFFSLTSGPVLLVVLWALGCSMIALGLLAHLPVRVLAVLSIAVILLHNLADGVRASSFGAAAGVWNVLHQPGVFHLGSLVVRAVYPLVPWIAVMSAGFCFGTVLTWDVEQRRRWMIRLGCGMTIAFLVLRWINIYGDPQRWSAQIPGTVVLSFLKCTKYPPSLDFLLMTLGPALLLLAWLDGVKLSRTNPLIVFGRVPLFYFILHFCALRLLTIPFAWWRYGTASFLFEPAPSMGGTAIMYPPGYGYDLWAVYLLWIGLVAALYPVCLWYSRLKERRRDWWLNYL